MPTYIVFDRKDGRILHTHREYLLAAEQSSELSEETVVDLVADSLPKGCEVGVTSVDALHARVGYRHYVDPRTGEIMHIESPAREGGAE